MKARACIVATVMAASVGATGCAMLRHDRAACRLASTAAGAVVGAGAGAGAAAASGPDENQAGVYTAGAIGGGIVGALAGLGIGVLACPEPPPPPAPPAPPAPPPTPPPGTKIETLEGPHFAFDRAELAPEGRARVTAAAHVLRNNPAVHIHLDGYTDAIGPDAYNLRLSERRAIAVRAALIEEGIAAERMTARGLGKANPVADNATAEGRAHNRRVEMVVQ